MPEILKDTNREDGSGDRAAFLAGLTEATGAVGDGSQIDTLTAADLDSALSRFTPEAGISLLPAQTGRGGCLGTGVLIAQEEAEREKNGQLGSSRGERCP